MTTPVHDPRYAGYKQEYAEGSRNPIDVAAHWDRRNPLNVFPLAVVVLALIALLLMAAR
jgi:hypothetical protein